MIGRAFQTFKETALANPVATRTFRTQMRGKRATRLWGLYAAILVLFATLIYASSLGTGVTGVADLQNRLSQMNAGIIGLLSMVVALVAPALIIGLIVSEYDRKSMDLILSSPLSLPAFFFGKLMSAWRVVWMILILAMPVSSVCVVMGGATLWDVLIQYLMVAVGGLLAASVAIPIAVLTKKVVPALLTSYGLYLLPYFIGVGSFFVAFGRSGPVTGGASAEQALLYLVLITVSVSWLSLAGAAAVLSGRGSRSELTLRVSALLLSLAWGGQAGWWMASTGATSLGSAQSLMETPGAAVVFWASLLAIFLPHLGTWDWHGESKRAPAPLFQPSSVFLGGASGGLGFLLLLFITGVAGWLLGDLLNPAGVVAATGIPSAFLQAILWGLLALFWGHSCYRLASAISPAEGGQPKKLGTGILLIFGLVPLAFIGMTTNSSGSVQPQLLALAPLGGPFVRLDTGLLFVAYLVLGVSGALFNTWAHALRTRGSQAKSLPRTPSGPPSVNNTKDQALPSHD